MRKFTNILRKLRKPRTEDTQERGDSYLHVYASNGNLNIEMRGIKRVVIYPRSSQNPFGGSMKKEDPDFTAHGLKYLEFVKKHGARKARTEFPDYVPVQSSRTQRFKITEYEDRKGQTQNMKGKWLVGAIPNNSKYITMYCRKITIQ